VDAARLLTTEPKRPIAGYAWSRDSKYILFAKDKDGDENFNVFAVDPGAKPADGMDAPTARDLTGLKGVRVMLVDGPKNDPDTIYIGLNDRDKAWHDLYKLKLSTGEKTLVRKNTDNLYMVDVRDLLQKTLQSNNPMAALEAVLRDHPDLPEAVGRFWADGFATDQIPPPLARFFVDRGASLSVHAAAGFGFTDSLTAILRRDPLQVNAKGGDGCTPLHFARDVATAQLLLDHGAKIDARDEDHDSTPAQWRIGKAPEVSRFLLDRGATADVFLAAALGDVDLTARLVSQNPACVAYRIGRLPDFPPVGHNGRGGTILQWTLAFNSYPHQIALLKGHERLFDFLYDKSDPQTRLLVCCVLARRQEAEAIHHQYPTIIANLPGLDLELLPRYCWETNTNFEAVRLMLDLGFPIAHTESSHGYSPLHNAAWSGDAALVDLLISRGHPVDLVDACYNATPLGYAIHDCIVEKRHPEGDFARVVESLLKAGSPWDPSIYPTGDQRIDEVLNRARTSGAGAIVNVVEFNIRENARGGQMKKGYWVVVYRSVSDESAFKEYGKLAIPAIEAGGGKLLIRTSEVEAHEAGLHQRVVVTEFESFEKAKATHNSAAYQAALKTLGSAAERDFRIVEGL